MNKLLYRCVIPALISLIFASSSLFVPTLLAAGNSLPGEQPPGFSLQGELAPVEKANIDLASHELSSERHSKAVTLVTGDTLFITTAEPGGPYSFILKPAEPTKGQSFQAFDTPEGYYVIPDSVNLKKLDIELFNIRYLMEEGYYLLPSLPVIIEVKKTEASAKTLQSIATMTEDLGAEVTVRSHRLNMLAVQLPIIEVGQLSRRLLQRPEVEKIWLDRKVHIELNESVPLIGAPECWGAGYDGTGVKVAILDTGIDATHPDLDDLDDNPDTTDPKVIVARDFTSEGFTEDGFGHGTHCASIAAGTGEASDYLYKGVAPQSYLFNIKVLTSEGSGYDSWIINGIEYATLGEDGVPNSGDDADILSMSFGANINGDGTDPLSQAVDWATEQGVICVVAAGNSGPGMFTAGTPAVARKAITVGATTTADAIADFSSRGPSADYRLKPDVLAPGVDITAARASGTSMGSPVDDSYTMASGTSMATPHVAGAAALILQANPTWEPVMVKSALTGYAEVIEDAPLWAQGGGRIQVPQAAEATLLAIEPSLSFGRLGAADVKSATVTLMNLGDAPITASITTHTTCEGVETDYVEVTPESLEIPAGASRDILVEVGPLDEAAPEGWYEGWVNISYDAETLVVPYLFGAFSTINVTLYDTDGTTEIYGGTVLATHPGMEFVAFSGDTPTCFWVKSGDYALLTSCGWITRKGEPPDWSRMFMIEKVVTVPRLSDVDVSASLAEARVSQISTVNADGDNLTTHGYTQYFSGEPYYEPEVGKEMMKWSVGHGWFGFETSVPALTFYSSEYNHADKLSEAFGYYASDNLLSETYLPAEIYLLNWKYHDVSALPATITLDPADLARYNFSYDMPETYPENGLNMMNAFWFTWENMGGFQGWGGDTRRVLAGMNATYYLAPETATYWGEYMPTYGGWDWDRPLFGPIQDWRVGRHYPYPQIPPEKGETGSIALGDFKFAPYAPGLSLQVTPGGGSSTVSLSGQIWSGLTWPHWQWATGDVKISPYPRNRTPNYELYVDGEKVADGALGRPDGTWYGGLWWDDVPESWDVAGERGLLRIHMPTLATISNGTTYEVDFDLTSSINIPPLFGSIVLPPSYSPGENVTIEVEPAEPISDFLLEYSFDQGIIWRVAEQTGEGYLIPTEMAEQLAIRMSGKDVNNNSVTYVSPAVSLAKGVKLEVPEYISGTPGETVEIPGRLTTIAGQGLKGVAVSTSDGDTLTYTSPDEEGDFTFAYNVYEVPHELVITSATAGVYESAFTSVLIVEAPPVTTNDATDITTTSAALNGYLNSLGLDSAVDVSFEWSTTSGNLDQFTPAQTMDSTGAFSTSLSNLEAGTQYFFRAKAEGSSTVYGNELGFTTPLYDFDILRDLPAYASPGSTFNVAVTFTSPVEGFHAIGLSDLAPEDWTVEVDNVEEDPAWCSPDPMASNATGNQAYYIWGGPYMDGIVFTAVYQVTVPEDAKAGVYDFTGQLEYYVGEAGPYTNGVGGDTQIEIVEGARITGETWEVKGIILQGTTVTIDGVGSAVSDDQGYYEIVVPEPGTYTVVASKDGFRNYQQNITITDIGAVYSLNFKADTGLVPNTLDISYVLACIHNWKFPPAGLGLDMSKVLAVIHAWKFPISD
jgi:subtilisin family serine protease